MQQLAVSSYRGQQVPGIVSFSVAIQFVKQNQTRGLLLEAAIVFSTVTPPVHSASVLGPS